MRRQGTMKKKFGFIMAIAVLIMLLLSSGSVLAYTVEGDFNTTPCNVTLNEGGDMWTLLQSTCGGIRTPSLLINPSNNNWIASDYVLVTGKNGSSALYSVGELDYEPVTAVTLTLKNGKVDLAGGGRTVNDVANIAVIHAVSVVKNGTRFFSQEFVVSGAGLPPQTYDRTDLEGMTQVTYTRGSNTYTGPTLLSVLDAYGVDTSNMNSYVVAQATDNYATVLSMYEVTQLTGDQYALLELSDSPGGFARLVLPGDNSPGRWISNVNQIVVYTLPHKTREAHGPDKE